jgi:hypothetical protein
MNKVVRFFTIVAMLTCAGCLLDPTYGGGYSYPGSGYPGTPYPGNPYPDNPYPGNDYGGPFRCESRDNRTQHCPTNTRGGVRLVRQLSGSPCVEGRTWGSDRNGVWVTSGCRAEFIAGYGGGSPSYGSGLIRCESDDRRTRRCPASTRGGVRLARQLSSTPCIEGRTWGYDSNSIWVSGGCRAEFSVGRGGGPGNRPGNPSGPGYGQIVRCESRDSRQRRCNVQVNREVILTRQLSNSPCIRGTSWDWDRSGIWVSGGCRAEFSVR